MSHLPAPLQISITHSLSTHQIPHILQHILSHILYQTTQVPYLYHYIREIEEDGNDETAPSHYFTIGMQHEVSESQARIPRKSTLGRHLHQYTSTMNNWCLSMLHAMEFHVTGDDVVCCLVEGSLQVPQYSIFVVFRNVWNSCAPEVRRDELTRSPEKGGMRDASRMPLSEKQLSAIVRKILRTLIMNDAASHGGSTPSPGRNYCLLWHREERTTSYNDSWNGAEEQSSQAQKDPFLVWNQNVISFGAPAQEQTAPTEAAENADDDNIAASLESFHMKPELKFKLRNAKRQKFVVIEVGEKEYLNEDSAREMMNEWIECKIKAPRKSLHAKRDLEAEDMQEDDDDEFLGKFSHRGTASLQDSDESHVWILHRKSLNGFRA